MSYYLIDTDTEFTFDNIIIGKKITNDMINSKYYLYYYDMNPKEIYIKLPKLRLIYNMGNNKYSQVKIPIYPNYELTNKITELIKNLETNIIECFQNKKINKDFSSLICKKNGLSFIKTKITDQLKITSDINMMNITMNDFKINGQIEIVLKVSYIWMNENSMGLSSELYQIKYYAPPEQMDINFIDPIIILPKEIQIKPQIIEKPKIIEEKPVIVDRPAFMIPSIKDLNNAIRGLKSVNKDE